MSNVTPLSYDRVKIALRALGIKRTNEEKDGGVRFAMSASTEVPHDLDYLVEIRRDDVLHLVVEPHKVVDDSTVGAVLLFCNEWNSYRLWPNTWLRAFLNRDNGRVSGSYAVDFESGASDDLIADFLSNSLQSSFQFYTKLAEEGL
jgi:hypothetical protein